MTLHMSYNYLYKCKQLETVDRTRQIDNNLNYMSMNNLNYSGQHNSVDHYKLSYLWLQWWLLPW